MANLVGMTESAARQWLESNGLGVNVTYDDKNGEYGKVISSHYSEGTSVPEGTTVTITVSHKQQEAPTKATEAPNKPSEATSQPSSDAAQN